MVAIVKSIDLILTDQEKAIDMWSEQIGFSKDVIRFALTERISVYNRDIVPEASTLEAYTKFLKDAEILKPEDNAKFDDSFARKAMAAQ
jgi:hypothetical protein